MKFTVIHNPHVLESGDVLRNGFKETGALLPLFQTEGHIRQAEDGLDQATHGQRGIDRDGVGLAEKPGDELLQARVEGVIPLPHQLRKEARNKIACDGDHSLHARQMMSLLQTEAQQGQASRTVGSR